MKRILIVDDNEYVRLAMCTILDLPEYDVVECHDGGEAVTLLEALDFDLVITDLDMPGLNGWQLLEHIQVRYPGIRVILNTSHAVDLAKLRSLGGYYCLHKPADIDAVLSTVWMALKPEPEPVV